MNPELVNEKLETKLRTLVGWELSHRFPAVMLSYMNDLRVEYHDAVNKGISDFKYENNSDEREKLNAMQIFPLKGTKAPCPRYYTFLFQRLIICHIFTVTTMQLD